MPESKRAEHERLQKRTGQLKEEHAALDRDRTPFDQADHDRHRENLRQHLKDSAEHAGRGRAPETSDPPVA